MNFIWTRTNWARDFSKGKIREHLNGEEHSEQVQSQSQADM